MTKKTVATHEQLELRRVIKNPKRDRILFLPELVRHVGSVNAAVLVSQLIYWFSPDNVGMSRVMVVRDGRQWVAKSIQGWADECGFTRTQARTAIRTAIESGLVDQDVYAFGGALKLLHLHLNISALIDRWPASTPETVAAPHAVRAAAAQQHPDVLQEAHRCAASSIPYTETTAETTNRTTSGGEEIVVAELVDDLDQLVTEYRRRRPDQVVNDAHLRRTLRPFLEVHDAAVVLQAAIDADVVTTNAINLMLSRRENSITPTEKTYRNGIAAFEGESCPN
jgi:hypothetical protein